MAWQKTSSILNARINHHGLGGMVAAGQMCIEAERLMPGLFTAVSYKNSILHLELPKSNLKQMKMQEGRLIDELNQFAAARQLPLIARIRLTFSTPTDTM